MQSLQLIDACNRHLTYMRISITDRCNLRCLYCRPDGILPKVPHEEILSYEEILRIVKLGVTLGISKVRVTGGEPLVRNNVCRFLQALTGVEGLSDVSLTTNAVLLESHLERIKAAGIRRINVSLDTLDREKYAYIAGYDLFEQVWQGIQKAHQMGFYPIKINVVALEGINDDEWVDLAKLSLQYPFNIRFIEYMPIGPSRMNVDEHRLTPDIKERLSVLGPLTPVPKQALDGPAQRFRLPGAPGEIGFIRPISHHFCAECNRLRLTANGRIRPCLLSDQSYDIKTAIRAGASDRELAGIFFRAVSHKLDAHQCHKEGGGVPPIKAGMSGIGG